MAPPLQIGHQALGSKSTDFGRKMGRNLSEDLFFFCSSPDFGRKMGQNLSVAISNTDLCASQIFWFLAPSFQNPAYATAPKRVTSLPGPSPRHCVLAVQLWKKCCCVGNTVFDLTGPRFEPQTSCSKDERVNARPNNCSVSIFYFFVMFVYNNYT